MSADFDILFDRLEFVGLRTFESLMNSEGEFGPMLAVCDKGGTLHHASIPNVPGMRPVQVAQAMLRALDPDDVSAVAMYLDSYTVVSKSMEEASELLAEMQVSSIGELFKQGHPKVTEAFNTIAFDREHTRIRTRVYRVSVQDGLEWDSSEPTTIDDTTQCPNWANTFEEGK